MFLGFAGRVSQQAAEQFLWTSDFFADVQQHFAPLKFAEIPDGLIFTLDSFPPESPLAPAISKMRKLRNTTVRDKSGSLVKLATLHGAGIKLNHSRLVACKVPRDVATLIADEVQEQAQSVLHRMSSESRLRFCEELRLVASRASSTPAPESPAKARLWKR